MNITIQDFAIVFGFVSSAVGIINFILTKNKTVKLIYYFYSAIIVIVSSFAIYYYNETKNLNSISNHAKSILKIYEEDKRGFTIASLSFFETYKNNSDSNKKLYNRVKELETNAKYYYNSKKYDEVEKLAKTIKSILETKKHNIN